MVFPLKLSYFPSKKPKRISKSDFFATVEKYYDMTF